MKRINESRIIETDADIRVGVRILRRKCTHRRRVHDQAGDPPLRRYAPGFEGLARIIVGQQLSIASAEAIWRRVSITVTPMKPASLSRLADEDLRAAGLSRAKVRTLRAIAEAIDNGLNLGHLEQWRLWLCGCRRRGVRRGRDAGLPPWRRPLRCPQAVLQRLGRNWGVR
ncbi:MAG: hypothetical protein GY877_10550 [Hyphomicrobium sp.]|nr:hypothetical protein [Hyphomicrobium sp.]